MKILEFFGKYDLRQKCVEKYGEEFGNIYDTANRGGVIGDFSDIIIFTNMVGKVRKEMESKTVLNRLKKIFKGGEE